MSGDDRAALFAWAATNLSAADGHLLSKCGLASTGVSLAVGIMSGAFTSAPLHAEDTALAGYNFNVCGDPKASRRRG